MPKAYLKPFAYCFITANILFLSLSAGMNAQNPPQSALPGADEIVNRLCSNYDKLNNFRCELTKFERLGDKTDLRVYKYSFMKPRLIRMDIIKGKNRGCVAVYKDGKVYARKGGIFKPFVITCQLTDKMVTSLRGGTITESDWQSVVDKLKSYRKDNKLKLEGLKERGGRRAYVLSIDGINEDGATSRKLWIDASTFLPLGSETYEGKTLVNSMDYSRIEVDTSMPDSLFNL